MISEAYEPAENTKGWNQKKFDFSIEEKGTRDVSFVFDRIQLATRTPLSISLFVDTYYSNRSLEAMELTVNIASLLKFNEREHRYYHTGEMLCLRNPDQRCIGNLSSSLQDWPSRPENYFSYSFHCQPM